LRRSYGAALGLPFVGSFGRILFHTSGSTGPGVSLKRCLERRLRDTAGVVRDRRRGDDSGGQAQFSAALALQASEDKFGALHEWINGHLADDLSLSVLADHAGMSERSFGRHYAEATGQTPARAIETLRVEAARGLLSESRLPVKRIAQRCGFGSEETLRRSFLRLLAVTPEDYRSRFRS